MVQLAKSLIEALENRVFGNSRYPPLKCVKTGIYASKDLQLTSRQEAALLVHPYCIPYDHDQAYFRNLYQFVSAHSGLLITIEEHDEVQRTVAKFAVLGRAKNNIFIPSIKYDPEPIETDWERVTDFLQRWTNPPLKLLGGYYGTFRPGCLGVTESKLNHGGLETEVLRHITFSSRRLE